MGWVGGARVWKSRAESRGLCRSNLRHQTPATAELNTARSLLDTARVHTAAVSDYNYTHTRRHMHLTGPCVAAPPSSARACTGGVGTSCVYQTVYNAIYIYIYIYIYIL